MGFRPESNRGPAENPKFVKSRALLHYGDWCITEDPSGHFFCALRVDLNLAFEKIGDWKKILVQNQLFWNIVGARPTAAPCNSRRDNAAGIKIVWRTSPPLILHIHSLHQVATVTPSNVLLRRRGIMKFPPKNGVTPKLPSEVAQCL